MFVFSLDSTTKQQTKAPPLETIETKKEPNRNQTPRNSETNRNRNQMKAETRHQIWDQTRVYSEIQNRELRKSTCRGGGGRKGKWRIIKKGKEMRRKWREKEGIYRERRVSTATTAPTNTERQKKAGVR